LLTVPSKLPVFPPTEPLQESLEVLFAKLGLTRLRPVMGSGPVLRICCIGEKKSRAAGIPKGGGMSNGGMNMADRFYSIRQVADHLGVRFYRIKYAHQAGHVREPLRVGNTRFYTEADIQVLKNYFAKRRRR
jgi:hypothetical protein